tara:strand:- start:132 stop:332 length:201 start_codon:yes stop_codon:yes gene_type:complete
MVQPPKVIAAIAIIQRLGLRVVLTFMGKSSIVIIDNIDLTFEDFRPQGKIIVKGEQMLALLLLLKT